jgi:hypothetical protein
MAVNQSQVDHIITAASEDDPEVKLQNLEREVDLIKTSIKRLLMDIRERMNELENPFTITAGAMGPAQAGASGQSIASSEADAQAGDAKHSALEAREAALDARESQLDATKSKNETQKLNAESPKEPEKPLPPTHYEAERKMLDEQMLTTLRSQMNIQPATMQAAKTAVSPVTPVNEKLRLQKVYKLFKWTHQAVKKFGHDRLEIMMGSYQAMGYITKESCDEIREISRLMPANLGEEHELGPDEFVAELYALNRILAPTDTSLDRDMIEVMMEQRQQDIPVKGKPSEERMNISNVSLRGRSTTSKGPENDDDWMNLPDRI